MQPSTKPLGTKKDKLDQHAQRRRQELKQGLQSATDIDITTDVQSDNCLNVEPLRSTHASGINRQMKPKPTGTAQMAPSIYITRKASHKRKRFEIYDDNEAAKHIMTSNKKTKALKFIPPLEVIFEAKHENEAKEEKNVQPIDEKNVWKKDRKTRREFYCKTFPTIVITPVKGRLLTSPSSLMKFLGLQHTSMAKLIKAHTHSLSWKTVYVHFTHDANSNQIEQIIENFNQQQEINKMNVKEINSDQEDEVIFPKCSIFDSGYAAEAEKRRKENVKNPELNKCVLLKNVCKLESNEEIKETLESMNYGVEKIERFKALPIVKVQLRSSDDVRKILNDKGIWIGFDYAKVEIYDPYRRRPRRHFKQCKKCFGLNHIAEECNRLPVCKFCGKKSHTAELCNFKKNKKRYQCILCKGNHRSDSLQCPKIQQTREKAGIPYSKREITIIQQRKNKDAKAENSKRTAPEIEIRPNMISTQRPISFAQAVAGKQSFTKKNQKKDHQSSASTSTDEVTILRQQVQFLQATVNKLNLLVERLLPLVGQDSSQQLLQQNSEQFNINKLTDEEMYQ